QPGGIEEASLAKLTLDHFLGRGSPASLSVAGRLATTLAAADENPEETDAAFTDLIARLDSERGQESPVLIASIKRWTGLLLRRGEAMESADKPKDAETLYERAVKLQTTYLGSEHYLTRSAQCSLDRARILARSTPEDRRAVRESFRLMDRAGELAAHQPAE